MNAKIKAHRPFHNTSLKLDRFSCSERLFNKHVDFFTYRYQIRLISTTFIPIFRVQNIFEDLCFLQFVPDFE